ncbi:hypothetical protein [Pseudomonas putida]|uniref:hypothetical protein n=1 Tax=Pseudomonas putida TaxID=303 RepID=UPI0038502C79
MLNEKQFDFFFEKAQRRTESCPEPLRSKHRACLRGMRAAWMGLTEDTPADQLFAELWAEVFGDATPEPAKAERQELAIPRGITALQRRIVERLNAGARVMDICRELQCSPTTVTYARRRCTPHD